MLYLFIVFTIAFFIATIILAVFCVKLNKSKTQLEENNFIENQYKNVLSMIEYETRNYKEGQNPYTTLRNIQNIIYNSEEE